MSSKARIHGFALVACVAAALAAAGAAAAGTPDAKLLRTYQPVTSFDPAERFFPTSVQSFVEDSVLERQLDSGAWTISDPDPAPGHLPGPGTGAWRLNQQPCSPALPLGGLACYLAAWTDEEPARAVYGRVVRTSGTIVLQYWLFYYDNTYSYFYPPSDVIWQAHEGDWEVVNVVLSDTEQPLFLGYSQHCLGETRDWDDVTAVDGTHPLVYVAAGSHANYFSAGLHEWDASCVPGPAQALLAFLGLPLPRDYAFGGVEAQGGVSVRRIDDEVPAWVSFDGFWGQEQYLHAPAPIGTIPFEDSPVGPAHHPVWSDPLGTMAIWAAG